MGFISNKKKKENTTIEYDFASEIVEIIEEKLDVLDVSLPGITECEEDEERRIKSGLRRELISEIEDFIEGNKRTLIRSKIA